MAVECITTTLIAASASPPVGPYDLTTLATVHDELEISTDSTSKDGFLQRVITEASSIIADYCNRVFMIEAVQDQCFIQQDPYPYQVPGGVYPLQLSRWPMVNANVIAFTGNTHGSTTVDGIASTAGIVKGALVFAADGSIPAGTTITAIATNAITLSQAATSSEAALSLNTGVQVIQELSVGDPQVLIYGTDYTVDAARGWLIRLNSWTGVSEKWEAIPVTVQYQGGYATGGGAANGVPADLEAACLRLVVARYTARGRDPMLVEENQPGVGSQRFWIGGAPGQIGALPPEVESLVRKYRVPVVT